MKKGYVYKRKQNWYVAIPDSNYISGYKRLSKGFATKSKASDYLYQLKEHISDMQVRGAGKGNILCKTYFNDYLVYVKKNFAAETLKTYKGVIKDFLIFTSEKYSSLQYLNEIRIKVIEDYKIWLKDTGHKDNTVNNHLKTLKTLFNVAIKWELIEKSPMSGVNLVNVNDEKIIVTLNTPERFNLFFERCKKKKRAYYPHYYCAAKLALRFGELVTLEWDNIDFKNNLVRITRTETFNPKGRGKKDRKPKERVIPFSNDVAEVLKNLPRTHKRVFLKRGRPISRKDQSFRRWISSIVRGTELEGMTRFHELRHTAGDILGQSHNIYDIKSFMGHSDIRTTERYVRVADEAKKRMAETLGHFGNTTQSTTQ